MAEEKKVPIPEPTDSIVTTQHSLTIGAETINYTATTGTIVLRNEHKEDGHKPVANIFFAAYTKDGAKSGERPITFAFNGGPGSSSVWLHIGLLGPRRVTFDAEGFMSAPPYRLVNNSYSMLDVTDIVFIDPVTTGYSRAVKGEKADQFHGFEKDVASVAEFIRLYTSRYQRWDSPKFLCGESYGTTRSAALSGYLQNNYGMYLNGLLLISSILQFQTADFNHGNDLPYSLYLPTYCATAWYHGRLDAERQKDLRKTLDEAEAFAESEYATALMQGSKLSAEQRQHIATRLSELTGLSADYCLQTNLRIHIMHFCKELMRDQRQTVGRLDSRYIGYDRNATGTTWEYDPSYTNIQAPFTATLNDYVRRELGYESDLPYEILTGKVRPWDYKPFVNRHVDVAETLRGAMSRNPYLKVYVANGYYDLATPYFATEYTFNHLHIEPHLQDNISMGYFEAGHMMYVQLASMARLKNEMKAFVIAASNQS